MKNLLKKFLFIFIFIGIIFISVGFYAFPILLAVFLSQPLYYLFYIIHAVILILMLIMIALAEEGDGYDK